MRHKWCVVPLCKNTTARTPNKIFITVPREQDIRKKWLRAMKREDMSIKSTYYCCEDHFNVSFCFVYFHENHRYEKINITF